MTTAPKTQLDYLRRIAGTQARRLIEVTPTLDVAAYDVGDNLFTTAAPIPEATSGSDSCELSSLTITSGIVTAVAMLVFFFDRPVTLAAANAAFTLSDADMKFCQGFLSIATGDWGAADAGNAVMTRNNLDLHFKPLSNSTMYFAVKLNTIATYGASDLVFKFGLQT